MKVKNLSRKKKKMWQMNLLNLEQRDWQPGQSQYRRQKFANELAECREKRLFKHCQYKKDEITSESADHIRQESRLANQH